MSSRNRPVDNTDVVETSTIKIRFNEGFSGEYNKSKLIEKSQYFNCLLKPCYKDYKSDIIKINVPADFETYRQVMDFVDNKDININDQNVLKIYQLAAYFLLNELKKYCFDYFMNNLNFITVEPQLALIEEYPYRDPELKELVEKFKRSGRVSFMGLYLVQFEEDDYKLKLFFPGGDLHSEFVFEESMMQKLQSDIKKKLKFHPNLEFNAQSETDREFSNMIYFKNLLVVCETAQSPYLENHVFQYNIISGIMYKVRLNCYNRTVICNNDNNLFTVSVSKQLFSTDKLALSMFEKRNDAEDLKLSKSKSFNPLDKTYNDIYKIQLYFSQCIDDLIFVFFKASSTKCNETTVWFLAICAKTLSVKMRKNLNDCLNKSPSTKRIESVDRLFYVDERQQLFLSVTVESSRRTSMWEAPLYGRYQTDVCIFDYKHPSLIYKYAYPNEFPVLEEGGFLCRTRTKFAWNNGSLFGVNTTNEHNKNEAWTTVKTYHYKDNRFVANAVVMESYKKYGFPHLPIIHSAVVVKC